MPAGTSIGSPHAAAGAASTATAPQPAAGTSARPVTGQASTAQSVQVVAPFHPPQQWRQRGLASRYWVPVALSFGTVTDAIALVIDLSQHT